jgi:hypothetical protein
MYVLSRSPPPSTGQKKEKDDDDTETVWVNPYAREGCDECAAHGSPCLVCSEDKHGTEGPGYDSDGVRTLLLVHTHPNVFRSMIYWMNNHLSEKVALSLVRVTGRPVGENFFDVNVASLGMLGRSGVPTLSVDRDIETMFFREK